MSKTLEEIFSDRVPFPEPVSAIYFLWRGKTLLYVGQSIDVIGRLRAHYLKGTIDADSVTIMPCAIAELNRCEAEAIIKFKPELNMVLPTGGKQRGTISAQTLMKRRDTTTAPVAPGDCSNVMPEFGRIADVQRLFGLKRSTVYNLLSAGKIRGVVLRSTGAKSGLRLIHLGSVRALLKSQMEVEEETA